MARVTRALVGGGVLIERGAEQPYLDLELTSRIEQCTSAAAQHRIVVGPQAGRKTMTLQSLSAVNDDTFIKRFTAARDGFSLNCAVACEA